MDNPPMCICESGKLIEFRTTEKFCDTNIQVGNKVFRVHKIILAAASEYFSTLFNEHPDENTVTVQADELVDNVDLFEEVVLPFMYTHDDGGKINTNNVVKLIRLSALFTLQHLEDRCIQFIQENSGVSDILQLFTSDLSLGRPSWRTVMSLHIMCSFHKLCDDEHFMEFSVDDFKALLDARFFLSADNEDKFLNTLVKWCQRCEERRRKDFNDLIDYVHFPNISARYMKFLLRNFSLKTSSVENSPALSTDVKPISQLHMYIVDDAETIRVYSANKTTTDWNVSSVKKLHSNDCSIYSSSLASLELEDHLYTLDYSMKANSFNARSNVLFSSNVRPLKPPPIKMKYFSMCSLPKNIYVNMYLRFWDWDEDLKIVQDVDEYTWAFNKERITQGIFEYNITVDKWFPVPILEDDKLHGSRVTADNNVLYLVDGHMDSTSVTSNESNVNIRALDVRTSKWRTLTKNVCTNYGTTTLGYAHEEKIYVCPGYSDYERPGSVIGIYDLKTNSWEKFEKVDHFYQVRQLLFYENYLWTFGMSFRNPLCEIKVFDPVTLEWIQSPFSNVNDVTEDDSRNIGFKNAFIFKSTLF